MRVSSLRHTQDDTHIGCFRTHYIHQGHKVTILAGAQAEEQNQKIESNQRQQVCDLGF